MEQVIFLTKGTHTNSNIFDLHNKKVLKYLFVLNCVKIFAVSNIICMAVSMAECRGAAPLYIKHTPLY